MPPEQKMKTALATECIKFGWETFKKRPWFLIGVYVLVYIIEWVPGALDNQANEGFSFVLHAISIIVSVFATMGMTSFFLRAHDDVSGVALSDLWHPEKFFYFAGVGILTILAVVGGLILLIIPGIIFAIMFYLASYLVMDRDLGPIEAMRESARMTKGHKWELFLLMIASLGLIIIGLICLIVGVLVAMPVVSLSFVHAYRQLQSKAVPLPTPTPAA